MKKHPTEIKGFASLRDAAEDIGKLRYDALGEFLHWLMDEMKTQQMKDRNNGKLQLVDDSYELIGALGIASVEAKLLFDKYKKFMKDELEDDDDSSSL